MMGSACTRTDCMPFCFGSRIVIFPHFYVNQAPLNLQEVFFGDSALQCILVVTVFVWAKVNATAPFLWCVMCYPNTIFSVVKYIFKWAATGGKKLNHHNTVKVYLKYLLTKSFIARMRLIFCRLTPPLHAKISISLSKKWSNCDRNFDCNGLVVMHKNSAFTWKKFNKIHTFHFKQACEYSHLSRSSLSQRNFQSKATGLGYLSRKTSSVIISHQFMNWWSFLGERWNVVNN